MTAPEARSQREFVLVLSAKPPIMKVSASAPGTTEKMFQASKAASGTPTKFTRSFPAKAKASANVPERMMKGKTFMRRSEMQACMMKVVEKKTVKRMSSVLASIQARSSGVMKEAPFAPFITRK